MAWEIESHHCIAIGEGAIATNPYEFAIRVPLEPTGGSKDPCFIQGSTIMTEEEHEIVYMVIKRIFDDMCKKLE